MLAEARFFASLDLLMGYHRRGITGRPSEDSVHHSSRALHLQRDALRPLQRPGHMMQSLLGSRIGLDVLVYLDDVLIFAKDLPALLRAIESVLQLLQDANLKCKPSKCDLFTTTIHYLGHVVSLDGIRPEQVKLDKISRWPRPATSPEMALFLEICNYYLDLVPAFAHVSDALYKVARTKNIE